ncbi:3' terminal RNA ribose 2'-O-methyltransferase Hen1 [Actinokineospora sp. NBRC 105648]|uniref:3' terminal RNA ribose 2'-O-methyltransferase Hen1 n=1 Tax=Actinokineospora sp. NBRC 105648 TaxID=3032206 RepID=UPI0024A59E4F|nr:3' terminal RNA ribose 2'-O-methyltransferase Hen1 [Actinokineospora sp. NBRC 105648]GLZ43429.1 3' terminal RNA ribose 2'-O-methyltransferase Hen1 [Actinokineospora sp. NBRC 105648]
MLLTLTTTLRPATDLGYLLHKHPGKAQAFSTSAGTAHVFYPAAAEDTCTAALLLEVDPTKVNHVDDRGYTAGSMFAVALGSVFRTAMNGRCDSRPALADTPIPLTAHLPAAPCRGGADLAERLFTPLGWRVAARPVPLDPAFPEWGAARCVDLRLDGELRLADALRHLYVLLPVLDDAKHYWVGEEEVDKLLRAAGDWLPTHPERDLISKRYLAHRRGYVRSALERLTELDGSAPPDAEPVARPMAATRREAVLAALHEVGARRVLDLGCGGGALLAELAADPRFTEVLGTDVAARALEIAERGLARLPDRLRERVTLRQSALTYTDPELAGYDAAVLMEVVEHVDPGRLPALERAVFGTARPAHVVVTTPNIEYNALFPRPDVLRHKDHRFEWTRAEFQAWGDGVAQRRGYTVRYGPIGPVDPDLGAPTQLAVFTRAEA